MTFDSRHCVASPLELGRSEAVADSTPDSFGGLVGRSPAATAFFCALNDLVSGHEPVVLSGEVGSGKTAAARALHFVSARGRRPIVVLGPRNLARMVGSEGSGGDVACRVAEAEGGTLLLEGVDHLLSDQQSRLVERVEGWGLVEPRTMPWPSRPRIVATCGDLENVAPAAEVFWRRLSHRVKVRRLRVPTLRERRDDIPLLADHFRNLINERSAAIVRGLTDEAFACLKKHEWPGNVRELGQVIERCFDLCHSEIITGAVVLDALGSRSRVFRPPLAERREILRCEIVQALQWSGWNRAKAARKLAVSRETLYRRLHRLHIVEPGEYRI